MCIFDVWYFLLNYLLEKKRLGTCFVFVKLTLKILFCFHIIYVIICRMATIFDEYILFISKYDIQLNIQQLKGSLTKYNSVNLSVCTFL